MTGKAAFITGGARRIGREIALALARAGYDIALHYRQSREEAEVLALQIRAMGRCCELFQQDLRVLEDLPALIERVHVAFPALSLLVNNASIFRRVSFAQTTPQSLQDDMQLNAQVPFFLTQALAENISSGNVVNMLDTAIDGYKGAYFGYLLAKKSLAEFTQMAAHELGPNIRVNGVCPGFILPTEGGVGIQHDPAISPLTLPLGKATLEDVASAVLICAEASFMTGQLLYVDGGERLL